MRSVVHDGDPLKTAVLILISKRSVARRQFERLAEGPEAVFLRVELTAHLDSVIQAHQQIARLQVAMHLQRKRNELRIPQ